MATRTLLCVEPDETALDTLTKALGPYGFEIKNITNGDEAVEWGRKHPPALIIVSVEPKKVGYAICNKLKRNPELKAIPLILTSAEEPEAKFEQHKTFKLRADEYIFKPFKVEELVRKVEQLTGLGAPSPSSDEDLLSSDLLSSEIAIEADDIVDDSTPPPAAPAKGAVLEMEAELSNSSALGGLDAIFDKEAQAAFDALEMKDSPTVGNGFQPLETRRSPTLDLPVLQPPSPPQPVNEVLDEGTAWDEQKNTAVVPSNLMANLINPDGVRLTPHEEAALGPMPGMVPVPSPIPVLSPIEDAMPNPPPVDLPVLAAAVEVPPPAPQPAPTFEPAPTPEEIAAPPEPDMVNHTSMETMSMPEAPDGHLAGLQERIHELENDKRRLQTEIEELNGRLQIQPFHKERDLLSLRETINRKEKDLLDLRDALDAKERQMLDHKDRIREHERARRDLEEKMLAMEKTLVYANERVAALSQDKDRAVERERALKVRLDDKHLELSKAQDEIESMRKRVATAEDRVRIEVDKIRLDMENHVSDLEQVHRAEVAQMTNERQAAEASREEQVRAEKARADMEHAAEVEAQQRRAAEELSALQDRHDSELGRIKRENEKAQASLKEESAAQLAAERQAHEAVLEAKERDHKTEIQALRRRLEDELAAAEGRRQRELEEAATRSAADLAAADERRRSELQARDEEHHSAVADMDRRHLDEKTEMSERHRAELDQAGARAARAEGELAARTQELGETSRRMVRVEGELDTTRADLRDREVKLAQGRDRISELEAKVADFEDQILRAYQKMRGDDKIIEKAKRAVAVALTLLDDRGASPAPAAAPSTPPRSDEGTT